MTIKYSTPVDGIPPDWPSKEYTARDEDPALSGGANVT